MPTNDNFNQTAGPFHYHMIRVKKFRFFLQAFAFAGTAYLLFLIFRGGVLDENVTRYFYNVADPHSPWPYEHDLWVWIAYQGGSILTAIWGLGVIIVFSLGFLSERLRGWRTFCVLSFLVLALGPGLLVNAIFKDNWGRPRPRETIAFGGEKHYQAPFVLSDQGGKSFPCGHCSVGFSLCVIAMLSRRGSGKRALFVGGWIAALLVGGYLGAARVAVGAHYFSDVLSSAWSVFLVAWLIQTFLPRKKVVVSDVDHANSVTLALRHTKVVRWGVGIAGIMVFALFAFFSLMALPVKKVGVYELDFPRGLSDKSLSQISLLDSGTDDVWVRIECKLNGASVDHENPFLWDRLEPLTIRYELQGFGYPWSDLRFSVESPDALLEGKQVWVIRIREKGLFRELNARIFPEKANPDAQGLSGS